MCITATSTATTTETKKRKTIIDTDTASITATITATTTETKKRKTVTLKNKMIQTHIKKMKTTPKPEKKKPAIKKMSKKERFHRERRQALRQQRLMMTFLKGKQTPLPQQPKMKRKRTQPQEIEDADETPPRKKTDIRNRDAPT